MSNDKKKASFGSRFGYIMVAAGAAIGLGNIWKFPYLAYGGGGRRICSRIYYFMCCTGTPSSRNGDSDWPLCKNECN